MAPTSSAKSLAEALDDVDHRVRRRAFKSIGDILDKQTIGITAQELNNMISHLDCEQSEKDVMYRIVFEVDTDDNGKISVDEWVAFADSFCQEVMTQGHINPTFHCIIEKLDMFGASAWHEFVCYEQVSWLGAAFGLILRITFVVVVILGIVAFWDETKTSMRQEFIANTYQATNASQFFFYLRTPSWSNTLDPTLLKFSMCNYHKWLNESGLSNEKCEPLTYRTVGPTDVDWWPASITGVDQAIMPEQPVTLEGAYHLDTFQQLQVTVAGCVNGTGVVCQSPEKIRAAIHGASVNFVVQSSEHGFVTSRTVYWSLMQGETKQVDLWFDRRMKITTAKFPWESDASMSLLPFSMSTQQVSTPWSDGTLAVWWFTQTPNAMIETSVRQTLVDLSGELGGSWATLVSVFGLAALWYNDWMLNKRVDRLRVRVRYVEDLRISVRNLIARHKADAAKKHAADDEALAKMA